MIYYQNKNQAGFSLVETLVAISILLIVIVGPMTISTRAAKSSSFATEQVQAFFLAQEGLELVEKVRDDLLVGYFAADFVGEPWKDFIKSDSSGVLTSCYTALGCGLIWDSANASNLAPVTLCSGANCRLYNTNSGRSRFTHTVASNTITPFTRIIKIEAGTGSVKVTSRVTWRTGSLVADQAVEVDTYLYDIYGSL